MDRHLLKTLQEYFTAIPKPTPKEQDILSDIKVALTEFPAIEILRDDLKQKGFDVQKITDDDMQELAAEMGEKYISTKFWKDLVAIATNMCLPMRTDIVPCPECDSCDTEQESETGMQVCNTCEHKWKPLKS